MFLLHVGKFYATKVCNWIIFFVAPYWHHVCGTLALGLRPVTTCKNNKGNYISKM